MGHRMTTIGVVQMLDAIAVFFAGDIFSKLITVDSFATIHQWSHVSAVAVFP